MTDAGLANTLNHIHRAGYILSDLLDLLYPPPLSPEIITREDVLNRYRLTGLGVPAITALQQAQRIVRIGKDYCQIGLCEFHIGLIYLYWEHCLAAAQQFAEARRQWLFADETASVCLTYLAEGQAQHHALHYEPAMSCYHKAEQWLPRLRLTPPSANLDEFVQYITSTLRESQETLRNKMWPPDEPERTAESPTAPSQTGKLETSERPSSEPEATDRSPSQTVESVVPLPRLNIVHEQVTPEVSAAEFSSLHDIPLPSVPQETAEPASFVMPIKEDYKWFSVVGGQGDAILSIHEGTWLLVDTQVRDRYARNELILIGRDRDEDGAIQVKPYITQQPTYKIIFLRRVPPTGSFIRDESGRVIFTADIGQTLMPPDYVVGAVIGLWLNPFQVGVETG